MYAPKAKLRIEQLWLQHDREVLLDLHLRNAEPSEMRFVARELEELVFVTDGDVAGLLGIGVNRWALSFPQVPVCDDSTIVERKRRRGGKRGTLRLNVGEVVLRTHDLAAVRPASIVSIVWSLRP
jgi:hypothetical protein